MQQIKIIPHKAVNDIYFGSDEKNHAEGVLHIEYKDNKVAAISFRNEPVFQIEEYSVNVKNIETWLSKENPYYDGECYIFPDLNIAAFGLDHIDDGYEITAYSASLETLYEKNISNFPRYLDIHGKETNKISNAINIEPYINCGNLYFGMNTSQSIDNLRLGMPSATGNKGNDTTLMHWDNFILRFTKDELAQITFENPSNLYLKNEDITINGPESSVFLNSNKFINRVYIIYFDYGIAFAGYGTQKEIKKVIVFSESMKSFWSNTKRPLI